tara:strand:- start:275 stop:1255 length:981 start_codon:yes stop_codon:yes gene_type:complete
MGYLKVTNKFWQSDICTGFGNRIPHWALAYKIAEHHDFKFTILLDSFYWPETTYVDFPHTESTFLDDNLHGEFIELTMDESILDLDTSKNYYLNGDRIENVEASEPSTAEKTGIFYLPPVYTLLKLKSSYLESLIKDKVKNAIGVHVRKNNVTPVSMDVGDIYERNTDLYKAYKEVDYLSDFNELIRIYKSHDTKNLERFTDNQLLYISSDISTTYRDLKDMNEQELFSLFPNYSDFFVTKEIYQEYNCIDYSDIIPNYDWKFPIGALNDRGLLKSGGHSNLVYFKKVLRDVVDLFSLVYCKDFIPALSTWSVFVDQYRMEIQNGE